MRPEDCRELANPTTPEAIALHLETCPTCASTSKLDRVWAATRAPAPSSAELDALWARAAVGLDRIEASRSTKPLRVIPLRGRRSVIAWVALAHAAVILVGVGINLAVHDQYSGPTPVASNKPTAPVVAVASSLNPTKGMVEVGFDETVIIRIGDDGHRDRVDKLADPSVFPSLADNSAHDVFNAVESMSNP